MELLVHLRLVGVLVKVLKGHFTLMGPHAHTSGSLGELGFCCMVMRAAS